MLLSCNLIKKDEVTIADRKKINTIYERYREDDEKIIVEKSEELLKEVNKINQEEEIRKIKESTNIIVEEMLKEAKHNCIKIEEEAYKEGYELGKKNGYEDSYKEGLDKAKEIINEAEITLENAKLMYDKYIEDKRSEILDLIFNIANKLTLENINKEKICFNYLNSILDDIKDENFIILKCNSDEIDFIKRDLQSFINTTGLKCNIEVIKDPLLEVGNYVINKKYGSIIVGIDEAKKEIRKILDKECSNEDNGI